MSREQNAESRRLWESYEQNTEASNWQVSTTVPAPAQQPQQQPAQQSRVFPLVHRPSRPQSQRLQQMHQYWVPEIPPYQHQHSVPPHLGPIGPQCPRPLTPYQDDVQYNEIERFVFPLQTLDTQPMQIGTPGVPQVQGVAKFQQLMDAAIQDVAALETELEASVKRLINAKDGRVRRHGKERMVADYILRYPPTILRHLRTRFKVSTYLQNMYRYQRGIIVPQASDPDIKASTYQQDAELARLEADLDTILETAGKKTMARRKRAAEAAIKARKKVLKQSLGDDDRLLEDKTPLQRRQIEAKLDQFERMEHFFHIVNFFEEVLRECNQDENDEVLRNVEYRTNARNFVPDEITSIVRCNDDISVHHLWAHIMPAWTYLFDIAEEFRCRPHQEVEWPMGHGEVPLLGGGVSRNQFSHLYNVALSKDGSIPPTSLVHCIEDIQDQLIEKNLDAVQSTPPLPAPYPWLSSVWRWEVFEARARHLFQIPENDRLHQKHRRLILVIYICLGYITIDKANVLSYENEQKEFLSAACLQSVSLWNRPQTRFFYAADDSVARVALYVFCYIAEKFEKQTLHAESDESIGFHAVWQLLRAQFQIEETRVSGVLGLVGEDGLEQLEDIINKEAATRDIAADLIKPQLVQEAWEIWSIQYVLDPDLFLLATTWDGGSPRTNIELERIQEENRIRNEQIRALYTPEYIEAQQRRRETKRAARKRQKLNRQARAREQLRRQLENSRARIEAAGPSAVPQVAPPSTGEGWIEGVEPDDDRF